MDFIFSEYRNISNEFFNNCRIMNLLTVDNIFTFPSKKEPNAYEVKISPLNDKKTKVLVSVFVESSLDTEHQELTFFDSAVMDTVYTLHASGINEFTNEMIIRVLFGDLTQTVTPKQLNLVSDSMNKLMQMHISIDCTAEFIARKKITKKQSQVFKGSFMPVEKCNIKLKNSRNSEGYRLIEVPALYRYAEAIKQIICIPLELFSIQNGLSNTVNVMLIKRQLLKRIERMKCEKNNCSINKISYGWYDKNSKSPKGFFADLGYDKEHCNNWRQKKSSLHHIVVTLLDGFKKARYITSYKIDNEANINGVTINPASRTTKKSKSKPVAPHPKPVAPHPKPVAPHPKPVTPRPRPVTPRPKPVTPRPRPVTPRPRPVTPRPRPVTPRPRPVTPRPKKVTLDSKTATPDRKTVILDPKPVTLDPKPVTAQPKSNDSLSQKQ